jgi:methylglutaconyl-CoA hydratase
MTDVLSERQGKTFIITLNRIAKHNAFDNTILAELNTLLQQAETDPNIRVIILKANGKHFSAGADAAWMQRMVSFSEEENVSDAKILADVMYALHNSTKTTIAMVQGAAYGGGAGLVAACNIAIAEQTARFCFPEVKLGLIPAVISPYVVKAIGSRSAIWLFSSAEVITAQRALQLGLVQYCVTEEELWKTTQGLAEEISQLAPLAVTACKSLVAQVAAQNIDDNLGKFTASLIAKKRVSAEGQRGLQAFLEKKTPIWD